MIKRLTKKYLDELTYEVIGAAIEVHKALGPGLLESVYHACMKHELDLREINYKSEVFIPICYKGMTMDTDLRFDLFVEDCLAVEFKAVNSLIQIHEAQLLSYIKLLQAPKGVLINFNCVNIFKYGQKTFVNELYRSLPDK